MKRKGCWRNPFAGVLWTELMMTLAVPNGQSVATMLPDKPSYEVVDAIELAQRWRVPVSWIREQTRDRACDPLPCVRLGRYVRFEWGSPKLAEWWGKRRT